MKATFLIPLNFIWLHNIFLAQGTYNYNRFCQDISVSYSNLSSNFFVFYLDIKFIVHLMHYSINIVVIIIIIILLVCFVFKNLLWYCQEFFLFVPPSDPPPPPPPKEKGSSVPCAIFCIRIFHFGVHKPIISKVTEYTDRTFKLTFA